jgi:hydrogenase nickel incorporation protein HypA/HybF
MHELGLCESVLEAVERRAAGRTVSGVRLRVGALHRVVDESMRTAFAMVATGSVADGAELDLVVVPVVSHCRDCGTEVESTDPLATCPRCGSADLDQRGGDELMLESIVIAAPASEDQDEQDEEERNHVPRHPG